MSMISTAHLRPIMGKTILSASLGGGGLACLPFLAGCILSYAVCPQVWIEDITRGKQKVPSEWVRASIFVASGFICLILASSVVTAYYVAQEQISSRFRDLFFAAYGVQIVINVFDLIVIDWILYKSIYPKFMQIEGVPKLEGYWPHVEDAMKGLFGGAFVALLSAFVAKVGVKAPIAKTM